MEVIIKYTNDDFFVQINNAKELGDDLHKKLGQLKGKRTFFKRDIRGDNIKIKIKLITKSRRIGLFNLLQK